MCSGFAELPAGWKKDFAAALAQAKEQQQPVLAYFTASWCGPCKLMARNTLADEAVNQALASFSRVVVDIDEHHDLAAKHGVRAVPTFQILTADADLVSFTTGYQDAGRFLRWLTNGVSETKEAVARREESEKRLAAADLLLRQADTESLRKAASELTELCAERESALSGAATERLAALARRDATFLLDGLNHPRLAARIHIANLLRSRLGDEFDVDPWSDAATRQQGVVHWREQLSTRPLTAEKNP